jgi:hypothetical protein
VFAQQPPPQHIPPIGIEQAAPFGSGDVVRIPPEQAAIWQSPGWSTGASLSSTCCFGLPMASQKLPRQSPSRSSASFVPAGFCWGVHTPPEHTLSL